MLQVVAIGAYYPPVATTGAYRAQKQYFLKSYDNINILRLVQPCSVSSNFYLTAGTLSTVIATGCELLSKSIVTAIITTMTTDTVI